MGLKKLPSDLWPVLPTKYSILDSTTNLFLNDDIIKAINPTIQFAEYYIQRDKKTLLLNIGESWTYGEALPSLNMNEGSIGTGIDKYHFDSQLLYSFGPNLALSLDSDLYQYAVPGNSNINMLTDLNRLLSFLRDSNRYEKIYLSLQVTEPNRDFRYLDMDYCKNSVLFNMLDRYRTSESPITFIDWLSMYFDTVQDWYQDTLNKYSDLNIDPIMWANFCTFQTNKEYSFKRIKPTWIAYSAQLENKEYEEPLFFNTAMLIAVETEYKNNVIIDQDWAMYQMNLIEKAIKYIGFESKYHNNHPNIIGHKVWASYLAKMSGWKSDT